MSCINFIWFEFGGLLGVLFMTLLNICRDYRDDDYYDDDDDD